MRKLTCKVFIVTLLLSCVCSCSDADDTAEAFEHEEALPSLTVVFATKGLGDMTYNDNLQTGVLTFNKKHSEDIDLTMVSPQTERQSRLALEEWLDEAHIPSAERRMLVLASSEYEPMLAGTDFSLAEGNTILLLETERKDWQEGVAAINMQLYGISYMAGRMMATYGRRHAIAILAMPGNSQLEGGLQGLTDGMRDAAPETAVVETRYLSDTEEGFAMTDSAFQMATTLTQNPHAFVYPLCGGAVLGIYRYFYDKAAPGVIGMDTDCSLLCSQIPFSVVKDVGAILHDCLEEWYRGDTLPGHRTYGLKDGYTFIKNNTMMKQRYDWEAMGKDIMDEVIRKEDEYERSLHDK